jgi:hypothetical protein
VVFLQSKKVSVVKQVLSEKINEANYTVVLVIYLMCKASLHKAALEILSCVKQGFLVLVFLFVLV